MPDMIRLAELTGAVARAADAGIGFPPETSLRSCLVAVSLGRVAGLADEELRDVYHAALLRHAGCTASAHEEAKIAGDEIQLRSTIALGDAGSPKDMLQRLVRGVGRDQRLGKRARTVATVLTKAPRVLPGALRGRCEVAIRFAVRLGLGPRVARALDEAFERWDGKGLPAGRRGEEVCVAARVISLAELAASYVAVGGVDGAREVVAARSGGHVDPALARLFVQNAGELLADAMSPSLWDRVLEVEPRPVAHVGPAQRRAIAELLADFADLKSIWKLGHSRGVAARALTSASELGATEEELAQIELAALMHDVGCVAVSNALWDKPGPLLPGELDQVHTHAFHTDRIVSAIGGGIGALAALASVAHERIDGSGYHRRLGSSALSKWARLLAAADVAQALSEARPHRPALAAAEAERALRDLARRGSLCLRAVEAVLGAREGRPKPRPSYPAGLSEREVEVLRLVARGFTDKEIAGKLGMSFRTVHHHNQHAYDKIGVSTRAAAALFLIENDLLDG